MEKILIRIIFVIAFFCYPICNHAQRVTKYIRSKNEIFESNVHVYVGKVEIDDDYVFVDIKMIPTKDMKRLNYYYGPLAKIKTNNLSLSLLGALSEDGESYHSCAYEDGWGWTNVKNGSVYSFTLVFDGTIPDYVEYIDIVDTSVRHGWNFYNLHLNTPKKERITQQSQQRPTNTPIIDCDDDDNYDIDDDSEESCKDDTFFSKTTEYYTAYTVAVLNLREGPGMDYDVITKIPANDWVFIEGDWRYRDFVKVMFVETGEEGYVSAKYLDGFTPVEVNEKGLLEISGESHSRYANVTLWNDADVTANIKLGNTIYKVYPHSSKTLYNIKGGKYNILVSSPGTTPYVGIENIEGGYNYQRKFYLSTIKY